MKPDLAKNPAFDAALARFLEAGARRAKRNRPRLPYRDDDEDAMTLETFPITTLGNAAAQVIERTEHARAQHNPEDSNMNEQAREIVSDAKPARLQFFQPTEPTQSATMMQVIAAAASNPAVDVDKMQQLFTMQREIEANEARKAFASDFAAMQAHLPTIDRNGRIEIRDKINPKKITQTTPFADWADINDAIKPIMGEYGFGLSFEPGTAPDGKVRITCILRHRQGHEVTGQMDLPHDSTGSKNAVQAQGSSIQYGKQYTACALLNITSRAPADKDRDGNATPEAETKERLPMTEAHICDLRDLMEATGRNEQKFCKMVKIASLTELFDDEYQEAVSNIKAGAK